MKLEIIRDLAQLNRAEPEWSSFARPLGSLTPFQLPVWLLTWWRHFGSGDLRVLFFREGGSLVGVAPCFLHDWHGAKQLTLIGSGISDYLDPVIHPQAEQEAVEMLRDYLESEQDWEVCNWQDLLLSTPLKALSNPDLKIEALDETECRVLRLSNSFSEYWNTRSASLRQNVRRDRAKAESVGELRFAVTANADAELLDALVRLHGLRWQVRGQTGTIAENHSAGFLFEVAREFAALNMLRLFSVHISGSLAAMILAFRYGDKLYNYLTAFDPQFEHLGVGRTLLYEALRYSFENNYSSWDFLRGSEPYKLWFGGEKIAKCRLIIKR